MTVINRIAVFFGSLWIQRIKDPLSRLLYGSIAWNTPVLAALASRGISLEGCKDPKQIVDRIRGLLWYIPDWAWGIGDSTKPPLTLALEGGGDCEDWALLHALACKAVLGSLGWKVHLVTYIASPWSMSHAFVLVIDPAGNTWILQPEPSAAQLKKYPDILTVWQPGRCTVDEVIAGVASTYKASVLWSTVREV